MWFEKENIDINSSESSKTPLYLSEINGQLEIVKYLIENGTLKKKTNMHGQISLIVAAKFGHLQIVKYLHEQEEWYQCKRYISSYTSLWGCWKIYASNCWLFSSKWRTTKMKKEIQLYN